MRKIQFLAFFLVGGCGSLAEQHKSPINPAQYAVSGSQAANNNTKAERIEGDVVKEVRLLAEAKFAEIRKGLTWMTVEQILGRKADSSVRTGGSIGNEKCWWNEGDSSIFVEFGFDGTVVDMSLTPPTKDNHVDFPSLPRW